MRIKKINLLSLRNDEHFQFHQEFKALVENQTALVLNIENLFTVYLPLIGNEAKAINVLTKNSLTDALVLADDERDRIFRGLTDTIKASCNHFDPNLMSAALELDLLLDHFGNLSVKPYNEETAAISTLIEDMRLAYPTQLELLNIGTWVDALSERNDAFENLVQERYSNETGKTNLRMKDVRVEADRVYNSIIERIEALIVINGMETHESFVKELNLRIDKYKTTIAQRQGRHEESITE